MRCITPPKLGVQYSIQVDVTVNQGFSCSSTGEDMCCNTFELCFVGAVSGFPQSYTYFDGDPFMSEGALQIEADLEVHMHSFLHASHYLSSYMHGHVIFANGELLLARSLSGSRVCHCNRGDFDCFCNNTDMILHAHAFVHSHANASLNHTHLIEVKSPAIGVGNQGPRNSSDYMTHPMLHVFGPGKYDSIPAIEFDDVIDIDTIEGPIGSFVGTELQINQPINISEATRVTVTVDGSKLINLPGVVGKSGNYQIQIADMVGDDSPCILSPPYCRPMLGHTQVNSVMIMNAVFASTNIVLSKPFTGSVSNLSLSFKNSVEYGPNTMLILGFPDFVLQIMPLVLWSCDSKSANCAISGGDVILVNEGLQDCPDTFTCVGIMYPNGLAKFEEINYVISYLQMPAQEVKSNQFYFLSAYQHQALLESTAKLIPFPPITPLPLSRCVGRLSNLVAGSMSEATIEWFLGSSLAPGNLIGILFPTAFILDTTGAALYWSSDSSNASNWKKFPSQVIEKGSWLFLTPPSDMSSFQDIVSMKLICNGLRNADIPGRSYNISIFILRENYSVISNCSIQVTQLDPAILTSAKASLTSYKTGAQTLLNVSFITAIPLREGSEIVLSLPYGFSFCSNQGILKIDFSSGISSRDCNISACPKSQLQPYGTCNVPRCDAIQPSSPATLTIHIGYRCSMILANVYVSFQVSSIRNLMNEGPSGQIVIYTSSPDCDVCSYARDVEWQDGLRDAYLEASTLANSGLEWQTARTGGSGNISISFATLNYLPKNSWIVIDIPQYFRFNRSSWSLLYSCSDPLGNVTEKLIGSSMCCGRMTVTNISFDSFACCTYSQLIFFKLFNRVVPNTFFKIQIAGISNMLMAGVATFQIRTASALWSFVDRAQLNITITSTKMNATVGPISYFKLYPDGTLSESLSPQIVLGAQGTFLINLKTSNVIPANGGLQVEFSPGFDLSQSQLLGAVQGLDGNITSFGMSNLAVINRFGGTETLPGANISFMLTKVAHPRTLGLTFFRVKTLMQMGSPTCTTCFSLLMPSCDICNNYGTIDDSGRINGNAVTSGQLRGLSASISPLFYHWPFMGADVSVNISMILGSNLSASSQIVIDLPSNFSSKGTFSVQTSSVLVNYGTLNQNSSIALTIRSDQNMIPSGSQFWILISKVRCSTIPTNQVSFKVQTVSPVCFNSTCILEAGSVQATCLLTDFDSDLNSATISQIFASVGAIAAEPTKNVSFGVTLVWNLTPSLQIGSLFSAQIASNFSSTWSYTFSNSISGRFYVDPNLLQGFRGSVLNFSLTVAPKGSGNLSMGVANVIVQSSPSAPYNISALNTGASKINVAWTLPADQGIGVGQAYFLTSTVIEIWRQSDLNLTLRSLTISCCPGTKSCCGLRNIVLSGSPECIRMNSSVPCISPDFSGQNISLRLRAFNAAGGGNFSSNLSVFVVGSANSLNLSGKLDSGRISGSPGIILFWSVPTKNFDFGLGPGVQTLDLLYSFEIEASENEDWMRLAVLPSNETKYCFCSNLSVGTNYSFRVRVMTSFRSGLYLGKWSTAISLQAIPVPTNVSIVSISTNSGCSTLFAVQVLPSVSTVSANRMILGFYVLQRMVSSFRPCCFNGSLPVQCVPSSSTSMEVASEIFVVSFDTGTLDYEYLGDSTIYFFQVNSSERGAAFQYQVLAYNSVGNATRWSDTSQSVQCQSSPLPPIQIFPPTLGDSSVSVKWDIAGAPLNYTQDFVYQVTLSENASYPFGGYFNEGPANAQVSIPTWYETIALGTDSTSMQSLRTYGARDFDFVESGGTVYLAVANSKAYADSLSLIKPGKSMFESSMIFVWNDTAKSFGGSCQWKSSSSSDCLSIGPLCAALAKNPTCMADLAFISNNNVLLPNIGAQQLIQTFGALMVKFMILDGAQYVFFLNSMVPASTSTFYCYDSATGYPVKVVASSNTLEPKTVISYLTKCNGRNDVQSCAPAGVCRPSTFQENDVVESSAPDSTGSFSVLYRLDPIQRLFLEHSSYSFQKPNYIEWFSAWSCVPMNACYLSILPQPFCPICTFPSPNCICKSLSFICVADELGPSSILNWDSTLQRFVNLQDIPVSRVKAARFFQANNESLLVLANSLSYSNDSAAKGAQISIYRLENGLFKMLTSVPTKGANHVEYLQKEGRHYLVICNGIDKQLDNSSTLYPCEPNVTCPIMYEYTAVGALAYVQSFQEFQVNQAVSSTSFSRVENDVRAYYLLFANYKTSSQNSSNPERGAPSYLYRWTTTSNVWGAGDVLFDGFALVRKIYTTGARSWDVFQTKGLTFAAVANEIDLLVDTSKVSCNSKICLQSDASKCTPNNPSGCLQSSCNYRSAGGCCETAGAPCIVSKTGNGLFTYPYLGSQVNTAQLGVSGIYNLSAWPLFYTQTIPVCTNNSITLEVKQSTPSQPDYTFYGADKLITIQPYNMVAVGKRAQIAVRPLKTPGQPKILSAQQQGSLSIHVQFSPPDSDGEIPKLGRSSVIMGYQVLVFENLGTGFVVPICSQQNCVRDAYTSSTTFTANGLNKGSNYSFFVFAINAAGKGKASLGISALAFESPSAVRNFTAQPVLGPLKIQLKWVAPDDLGAGPGIGFPGNMLMYYKLSIFSGRYLLSPVLEHTSEMAYKQENQLLLPDELHLPKFSFNKGVQYSFYLSAQTKAGQSFPVSATSCALTRSDPPTLISADVTGPAQIILAWNSPSDMGSGPGRHCGDFGKNDRSFDDHILMFVIEISLNRDFVPLVSNDGSNLIRCGSNLSSTIIKNLDIGSKYFFRVFIETIPGTSLPSNVMSSFAVGTPTEPQNLQVILAGPLALGIICSLPDNTGLGPKNRIYKLSYIQLDVSEDVSFRAFAGYSMSLDKYIGNSILTGLKAGIKYYFRVKAYNKVGSSSYSPVLFGIPLNVPEPPEEVNANTRNGFVIDLTWQVTV